MSPAEQDEDGICRTRVRVGVSDQFFAWWVTGSGGKMTVEEPEKIRVRYRGFLERALKETY